MRKQCYRIIYKLGERLRNPSLDGIFKELMANDFASRQELEHQQLLKLKALVSHAYKHSPFYRKLLDENHIKPEQINALEDLKKMPVLTKKDLIDHNKSIHTTNSFKFKKLFKAATSGSTGESLVFLRDEYADSFNRASIQRGYAWYGVSIWERNGYLWGYDFDRFKTLKTKLQDFFLNRFRLYTYNKKELGRFIHKLKKASYLGGYSSMIYRLAKLINDSNKKFEFNQLKMIKGTSEKIYESYHEVVQEAFGRKIISEYGAAETGIIAFECPHGKMHINMEGVIVEVEQGEIIVTNLSMTSFPVIRFKLGDYVNLAEPDEVCACGRQHRMLHEVTGRIGQDVYGFSQIYPSLYFVSLYKNLVKHSQLILTYQTIQPEKGKLIFKVEETLSPEEQAILEKEIVKYFKDDIVYDIQHTQVLSRDGKGKLKSFISYV
ncbi:MAG: capsule biosynthesis protein CapK [Flavobacteriia bacterium]|nr:MAG: capsule biosynthesis protein CapK [Flavobacteriia bacterium]